MNLQTHHFNTGVRYGVNPYLDENAKAVDAVGGGLVMVIPFEVEELPKGAKHIMSCNNPDLTGETSIFLKGKKFLVREIINPSKMVLSKYAYFEIK